MLTQIQSGLSIEFEYEDKDLVLVGDHEGLPLYKVVNGDVVAIALVEKPANQTKCTINYTERLIAGVVIIPNQRIYRIEPVECYWFFPEETIKILQQKFINKELKSKH